MTNKMSVTARLALAEGEALDALDALREAVRRGRGALVAVAALRVEAGGRPQRRR